MPEKVTGCLWGCRYCSPSCFPHLRDQVTVLYSAPLIPLGEPQLLCNTESLCNPSWQDKKSQPERQKPVDQQHRKSNLGL